MWPTAHFSQLRMSGTFTCDKTVTMKGWWWEGVTSVLLILSSWLHRWLQFLHFFKLSQTSKGRMKLFHWQNNLHFSKLLNNLTLEYILQWSNTDCELIPVKFYNVATAFNSKQTYSLCAWCHHCIINRLYFCHISSQSSQLHLVQNPSHGKSWSDARPDKVAFNPKK